MNHPENCSFESCGICDSVESAAEALRRGVASPTDDTFLRTERCQTTPPATSSFSHSHISDECSFVSEQREKAADPADEELPQFINPAHLDLVKRDPICGE
jgi:hypothetical protein